MWVYICTYGFGPAGWPVLCRSACSIAECGESCDNCRGRRCPLLSARYVIEGDNESILLVNGSRKLSLQFFFLMTATTCQSPDHPWNLGFARSFLRQLAHGSQHSIGFVRPPWFSHSALLITPLQLIAGVVSLQEVPMSVHPRPALLLFLHSASYDPYADLFPEARLCISLSK